MEKAKDREFLVLDFDENFRMTADQYCFILKRRREGKNKKTGEPLEGYNTIGYYGKMNSLLRAYARQLMREAGMVADIDGIVTVLVAIQKRINDACLMTHREFMVAAGREKDE